MDKVRGGVIIFILLVLGLGGFWGFREFSKPLPGREVADLGREHSARTEWEKFSYNSNPPTSGPHDTEWIRAGIYNEPQGDGYLVHSLEHGYIIVSYNCTKLKSKVTHSTSSGQKSKVIESTFAHEEDESSVASDAAEASPSGVLKDDAWRSDQCPRLKDALSALAKEKRIWKLIVVPRPSLDAALALTAWGRIDTLNTFDSDRINRFIDAYRDRGPERTTE